MSFSAFAHSENSNNAGVDGATSLTENATEEAEETIDPKEITTSDSDSSYYSVNKFNFLFYFVYKTNFIKEEVEVEEVED